MIINVKCILKYSEIRGNFSVWEQKIHLSKNETFREIYQINQETNWERDTSGIQKRAIRDYLLSPVSSSYASLSVWEFQFFLFEIRTGDAQGLPLNLWSSITPGMALRTICGDGDWLSFKLLIFALFTSPFFSHYWQAAITSGHAWLCSTS